MSTDNIGKDKYEGRSCRLIEDLKIHPEAEIFPLMDGKSIDELAEDIKVNGMKEPVVIDKNWLVVDGRNRLLACQRINVTTVECRMVYLDGDALRRQIIS